MNTKALLWIVSIILVIIGGILLIGRNYPSNGGEYSSATSTESGTAGQNPAGKNTGMKTTLGGIFDIEGNYQCDYDQVSLQSRSTDVIYISDGKLRGEFRTKTATTSTNDIVLYDGSNLYVWTEGKATGKVSVPKTIKDLPSIIPEDITSGRILGSGLNSVGWNCHVWSLVASKLVKPTNVTFR